MTGYAWLALFTPTIAVLIAIFAWDFWDRRNNR